MVQSARPGWKTSEFWVTIASLITSGLLVFGIIQKESIPLAQESIAGSLDALALIVAQAIICIKYLRHRKDVKVASLNRKRKTTRKRKVTTTPNKEIKEEQLDVSTTGTNETGDKPVL